MDATIEINSEDLRAILKSLSAIYDEGIISLTKDGLSSKIVDPANVCMISIDVPAIDFEKYKIESNTELGFAFDKTMSFIDGAKNETVLLELNNKKLTIKYSGFEYTQTTIEPSTLRASPKIPELEHDVNIEIPTKILSKNIKACTKIDNFINFQMLNDVFTMWSKGVSTKVNIDIENPLIRKSATAMALYSIDYLQDIAKGLSHTSDVCILLSTDFPIVFESTICETGTISYLLAPRIDSD